MSGVNPNRPTTTPRTTSTPQTQTPAQTPAQTPNRVETNVSGSAPIAQRQVSGSYDTGSAFEASTSGTLPGGIEGEAHVSGPSFSVEGNADASVGMGGIDVNLSVDVSATLAEGGASATKTFEVDVAGEKLDITVDLSAEGVVGADGSLNLDIHIGTDGQVSIEAGAEGFAGARASLTGGVKVEHEGRELASGSVELSATAGVSGDAHANIELTGEGLSFDVGAEASAGVGFGVDIEGNINAGNTVRFAGEVLGGLAEEGVEWAGDRLEDIGDWAGDRLEDVGQFIDDLIPDIDLNPFN
ncbi:transporter [Stigmatella sp. ncwal1]|uniref:Transporter n=1 Tax=Stigmatella ashevillensis TaxID=2995309 RepID=A0ABT5DDM9_9BACT|nr:transporter [Stigmatella ashevillena]MDC0711606.1 transporter [Stigmatella ashevillena]